MRKSVFYIIFFWILAAGVLIYSINNIREAKANLTNMDYKVQLFEQERDQLLTENTELREKMERSAKIETPEQTRTLAQSYIKRYFPEPQVQERVMRIVKCESNFNNMAFNKNKNGSVDKGIFQINSVHEKAFKKVTGFDYETGANDFDANVKYARYIYDTQENFSAWVCDRIVNQLASK